MNSDKVGLCLVLPVLPFSLPLDTSMSPIAGVWMDFKGVHVRVRPCALSIADRQHPGYRRVPSLSVFVARFSTHCSFLVSDSFLMEIGNEFWFMARLCMYFVLVISFYYLS